MTDRRATTGFIIAALGLASAFVVGFGQRGAIVVACCAAAIGTIISRPRRLRPAAPGRAADAVVEAALALHVPTTPDGVPDLIAELACSALDAETAAVYLRGPHGLVCAATHGSSVVDAFTGAIPGRLVVDGERIVAPMTGSSDVHGVLVLDGPGSVCRYDRRACRLVELFARQAGHTIERCEVISTLTEAAMRDPLTGIGNRRHADWLLESLNESDGVVVLDLDRFKDVNDAHGHLRGDDVLRRLGRHLRDTVRDDDLVARLGGEEFLVVVRGAGAHSCTAADRLLEGWRRLGPLTTFSVGVAVHEAGRTSAATFALADEALYAAKAAGRGVVCMHTGRDGLDPIRQLTADASASPKAAVPTGVASPRSGVPTPLSTTA